MEGKSKFHIPSILLGIAVGWGIVKLAVTSPGIAERWPGLFSPISPYILPIGLIATSIGAAVTALTAPVDLAFESCDGVGAILCPTIWFTIFPEPLAAAINPMNLLAILLPSIAYSIVGVIVGKVVTDLRKLNHSSQGDVNDRADKPY